MSSVKQKRDSAYRKMRLSKEAPKIYDELLAGKYPSVRAAAVAAGIVKEQSRLARLKSDFLRATPVEKKQFLKWLLSVISKRPSATPGSGLHPLVGTDGLLLKSVRSDIQDIMDKRRLKPADVCAELGFSRLDPTWLGAYTRRRPPKQVFLDKLPA